MERDETDADLIRQAQHGEAHAFRLLVERYADPAWRTARVLLADRGAAEDALQEAWMDAWRGLSRFQGDRPFRPWLLRVVANRCRMAARRRIVPAQPLLPEDAETVVGAESPVETLLRREGDAELYAALSALPVDQRHVVELRFFAELDLADIACVLAIPLGTVKSRLHRALLAVRQQLAHEDSTTPLREGT